MKRISALLIALTLSGCATHEVPQEQPTLVTASAPINVRANGTGPEIAAYLTKAYNDTATLCKNRPSAPAFLCSGVLLRATNHSASYRFWDPNPQSTGVSFSFLRTDANFNKLVFGYKNGFIFYPLFFSPVGKVYPTVLCFFPVDAGADLRDDQGCGVQVAYPVVGKPCQSQGINTAAQYIDHYNKSTVKYGSLCGFNVRDSLNEGATTAFNEALKAQGMGGTFAFNTQNEFRMGKWAQGLGKTLPIEAVFYISDSGKASAQADQKDFKTHTDIWIPVIKITLPQTPTEKAKFEFFAADQAITS
ncbi:MULTISPECIES: hypothetical protein [unclassified Pseudomonas]|jgi:hypothetical protein|uniref:hypothetical protein n=1 Tax=unclassified Pseudomonas TaxID=196821 RepID=UPI00026F8438|nr:hypothetical protein [Pseudomonas sp. GM80]EJN16845.1 hypothetical protein PMI37_06235 [Pseudomonas sp. GM80]